jgi:membrane protease YdiL (CAAX protease family)
VGLAALFIGLTSGPPLRGILVMAGLGLIVAGLGAAAGQQLIARKLRPADKYHGPAPLILFFMQLALVTGVSLILYTFGAPLPDTPLGFLLATVILVGGYLLVVWLFVVRGDALSWRDLIRAQPLNAEHVLTDIAIGALAMFGVAIVAGIAGTIVSNLLGGTQAPQVVPPPTGIMDVLCIALGAGILVPIGEEVFFRGFAITAWLRDLGPRTALIRGTLFFALVHLLNISSATFDDGAKQAILELTVIAPVGLVLGLIYLRRGLVASIAGHAAFNLFGVLVLVLAQNLPAPQ